MNTIELITGLLYEEESNTLDFKSEQYEFVNATDYQKSRLLQDILSFANTWRRSDAYILIGVKEVQGGKSVVQGITTQLDDAMVQQFIDGKVNRPLNFSYLATEIDGKQVALITIPVQKRPFYVTRDYVGVKENVVYLRRGSSSAVASLEEIAGMGLYDAQENKPSPTLKAFFATGEYDETHLEAIEQPVVIAKVPTKNRLPLYGEPRLSEAQKAIFGGLHNSILNHKDKNYYTKCAKYIEQKESSFSLNIGVKNNGKQVATDIQLTLNFERLPKESLIYDRKLQVPESQRHTLIAPHTALNLSKEYLSIKTTPTGYCAKFTLGKLQPGQTVVCPTVLYLMITDSSTISADVTIYADELEAPQKQTLDINVVAQRRDYSIDDVVRQAEDWARQSDE